MITGARQIGKSYIIRKFGYDNYKSVIEINFFEHPDYAQELERKIILHLAKVKGVDISTAMDWYYRSRLSDQISQNLNDIAYLDSKYLARDLIENEPELFM